MYVLPTNKILHLCSIYNTPTFGYKTILIRWNPDGTVDSSFANDGYSTFPAGTNQNEPRSGFLQADGKLTVFGNRQEGSHDFIGRFNEDGSIDHTLGNNGIIVADEHFADGFVQPDGKFVTTGWYGAGTPVESCSILRFLGSNSFGAIEAPSPISTALLYPNPVADQTLSLAYELPSASAVRIDLLDLQGRTLGTMLNAERTAGKQKETISLPANLANGFYFLDIRTNKGNAVIKVSVIQG